ncbi:MAG: class I SAM-dependent methyltransferase [Candidatus Udaeobacter sp.]
MNKTEPLGQITGKITATPNPICFGQHCVVSWDTNDPAGAEVRVSTSPGSEKLLSKGQSAGQAEIPWITDSVTYDFRLYGASQPDKPIDAVKVKRDSDSVSAILRKLASEAKQGNIDMIELSQFIAAVMPHCLHSGKFHELFPVWEQHGFHVTPVHFHQPIPDTRELAETLWKQPSNLVGIDMNDAIQLNLLRNHLTKFRDEYNNLPIEPPPGQKRPFHGVDALVAYCMVRHFQPRRIIEVGSGFSSLVLGQAAAKNKNSSLICIDPFPRDFLRDKLPGLQSLITKKVQDMDLEFFSQLQSGDILFIDSSHTVKIGGDVNYLFLEVLPRLQPGVIVHVHDIFLPFEYRRDWVLDEFRFWNEQYLLQAFLTFNSEFEVLLANSYLNHYHQEDLKAAFRNLSSWASGSFWMRRKPSVD